MKPTYDPSLDVPAEIKEAAERITIWMTMNGWCDWELLGVADRKLVGNLRKKIEDLEYELLDFQLWGDAWDR